MKKPAPQISLFFFVFSIFVSVAASPWFRVTSLPDSPTTVQTDSVKTDPETGLAVDTNLMLVKGQCTVCHSSKLILQSHFSREKWIERIRWMQRTQKLWDLGESEPAILDYLVKHYGPIDQPFDGRRQPLSPVKWRQSDTRR
ncbi:hypothetical protein HNV11_09680 [Spirosoma taeanense]|uniref:Sulfite dehydrogenase (Cytochrome) subunit SorB n=1 Tax=Spirosoma taeanense TaxID=2735870 RepID=A0A6M5Y8W2_9BACT|nr:hypothetical protein [Spirosoma taeanense]QJW89633.1 hypothetical protein HNV11_09680 [Spirosoma taeanense]